MDYNKKKMSSAAVRSFHFYRTAWVPTESDKLKCTHEKNNPFNDFAIKTMNNSGQTVWHLPLELSRITKFLIDRGAKVEAQLSSKNFSRSPLIQGGLEIPSDVLVTMPGTIDNQFILEKYRKLVCEKHAEPKEEVIIGSFLEPNVIAQTGPSTIQNQQKQTFGQTTRRRLIRKNLSHHIM